MINKAKWLLISLGFHVIAIIVAIITYDKEIKEE